MRDPWEGDHWASSGSGFVRIHKNHDLGEETKAVVQYERYQVTNVINLRKKPLM